MSRAWTKLINTQLKDLTSTDLMKLGQLSYVDVGARGELKELNKLKEYGSFLQAPGQPIFADSLNMASDVVNAGTESFKPSTIYADEDFASDYLVQVLAVSGTVGDGDTGAAIIGLSDGSNSVKLLISTSVTISSPLVWQPYAPLYINESNYLAVANGASVDMAVVVYCAIVARGGA